MHPQRKDCVWDTEEPDCGRRAHWLCGGGPSVPAGGNTHSCPHQWPSAPIRPRRIPPCTSLGVWRFFLSGHWAGLYVGMVIRVGGVGGRRLDWLHCLAGSKGLWVWQHWPPNRQCRACRIICLPELPSRFPGLSMKKGKNTISVHSLFSFFESDKRHGQAKTTEQNHQSRSQQEPWPGTEPCTAVRSYVACPPEFRRASHAHLTTHWSSSSLATLATANVYTFMHYNNFLEKK